MVKPQTPEGAFRKKVKEKKRIFAMMFFFTFNLNK
jgi:hypothetical protein